MSSIKNLPDFIYVANLKNIFWNNDSDLYPNNAPDINLYTKIEKTRPIFYTPYNGSVVLEGSFNHALYNGKYYKLIKIKVIDIPRNRFEYQLEEDMMMNLLKAGGEVKGILNRTNNPEILRDCLPSTQPILETPANLTVNLFLDVKKSWKETAQFITYNQEVLYRATDLFISNKDWYGFKKRHDYNLFIKTLQEGKKWNTDKKVGSQAHTTNQLFIVNFLRPTLFFSWKALVIDKVIEFCKDWSDKKLSKVSFVSGAKISGKTCITYEDSSFTIGATKEEQLDLLNVDLSGLTDVVLVDDNGIPIGKDNQNSPFYREPELGRDLLEDVEGMEAGTEDIPFGWYAKLCRKPYLPIRKKKSTEVEEGKEKFLPVDSPTAPAFKTYEQTEYTGEEPQEIILKDDVQTPSKRGWLWHINRLDFALVEGWGSQYKDDERFNPFRKLSFFDEKKAKWGDYYFFRKLDRRDVPPVGFLIFQQLKDRNEWDDFEYIGHDSKRRIFYRSGLKTDLLEKYRDLSKWWSFLPPNLSAINGIEEFSKMTLDIDLFNWITFAPSAKGYLYKWTPNDYFNHYQFFPNRTPQYPSDFLNWDIEANKEWKSNPFTPEKITQYLGYREVTINSFSFSKGITLEETIKQNDIFFSDLEYSWKQTPFYLQEIPIEFDETILKKITNWMPATLVPATAVGMPVSVAKSYLNFTKHAAGFFNLSVPRKEFLIATTKHPGNLANFLHSMKVGWKEGIISHLKYLKHWKADQFRQAYHIGMYNPLTGTLAKEALTKGSFGWKRLTEIYKLRALFTGARAAAALKSIGITIAIELVVWGIMKAIEENTPDDQTRLQNSIWSMGDFFGGEEFAPQTFDKTLVTYLHKGKFKFGTINCIEEELSLTDDKKQIIKTVEGKTTRRTIFNHLQSIADLDIKAKDLIDPALEKKLFKAAYKCFRGSDKIINISKEELDNVNTKILFDLKGTNWYAQIYKGKVHLIAKDLSSFEEKGNITTREVKFKEGLNPSVYSLINQKSDLVVFSTAIPLNTKFTFEKEENRDLKHFLKITPMKKALATLHGDEPDNLRDYWHVEYRTPFDYINTWVSAYTIVGVKGKEIDIGQYERLRLLNKQNDEKYWIETQQNQNLLSDRKLRSSRLYEDLDKEYSNKAWRIAESAIGGGIKGSFHGGLKGAVAGSIIGAVGAGINLWRFGRDMDTQKQRFTEDEINFIRDNHLSEYSRKQNYEFKKSEYLINLNNLTNTYIKPTSSDDDLERAFNKLNNWDDMHLKIYLPTQTQEQMIKEIYDEFGCYCRSNWYENEPLIIENGMEPGLFQFSNLELSSITSTYTTDVLISEVIRNVFITGTKFIDFQHEALQEETLLFIAPKGTEFNFDTSTMAAWDDRLWDKYYLTKPKSEILNTLKQQPRYGLSEDEYNSNKDRLDGASDDDLFERVKQITTNRQTGTIFVLPTPKRPQEEVEKELLNTQINDLNRKVEELEQNIQAKEEEKQQINEQLATKTSELETCKNNGATLQQKVTALEGEKQQLNQQLTTKTNELEQCQNDGRRLQQQITDVEREKTNLTRQVQEKDKQIAAKDKQITDKQTELDRKKQELAEKDASLKTKSTQVDQSRNKVSQLNAKITKMQEQINKLQTDKSQLTSSRNSTRQQLAKCAADYQKLLMEKGNIDIDSAKKMTELDECKAKLHQIEKDKQDLQTQLDQVRMDKVVVDAEKEALENEKTHLIQEKSELTEQLRQCKINLQNLSQAKNTCDLISTNKIKELEDKLKEKQIEIDAAKAGLSASVNRADTLSKEYKDLEAKKTEFENVSKLYKAEADKFKKEKELLENQKAEIEGELIKCMERKDPNPQLVAQNKALEEEYKKYKEDTKADVQHKQTLILDLQRQLEEAQKEDPDLCGILKKYIADPYEIDLKKRADGGNALRDLVTEVIRDVKWMRYAALDNSLAGKYPIMQQIFDKLMDFQEIPLVAKWSQAIYSLGWTEYKSWLDTPTHGDLTIEGKKTKAIVDSITGADFSPSMESVASAHSIKAVLDKLNWLTYKAKDSLTEQLKTDTDLQYMFKHVYPGKIFTYYENLFGRIETALVKQKFIESVDCSAQEGTIDKLIDYKETIEFNLKDINPQQDRKRESTQHPKFDRRHRLSVDIEQIEVGVAPRSIYHSKSTNKPALIESTKPYNTRYQWNSEFQNRRFSFLYTPITGKTKEAGAYFGVESENIWQRIMERRRFFWENRHLIKAPSSFTSRTDTTHYLKLIFHFISSKDDKLSLQDNGSSYGKLFEIFNFNADQVRDAVILIGIITSNKLTLTLPNRWVPKDNDGYSWFWFNESTLPKEILQTDIDKASEKLFPEGSWSKLLSVSLDFSDWKSLLNYVWRHIKLGIRDLEDPFSSNYSNLNMNEMLNKIWKENK